MLPLKQLTAVILLTSFFALHGESHRILAVLPFGSTSHKITLLPLLSALAEKGHHVTFLTNKPTEQFKGKENVREVIIKMDMDFTVSNMKTNTSSFFEGVVERPLATKLTFLGTFRNVPIHTIERTLENAEVKSMMETETFDLAIISMVTLYAGYPLAWHFKCPFILVSPNVVFADTPFVMGDYEHTEYVPFMLSHYDDRMSLMQRLLNTAIVHLFVNLPRLLLFSGYNAAIQKYVPDFPSIEAFEKNISVVFTNSHPSFTFPRALPPGVIEIGAVQCRPPKPLPETLNDFIEGSGEAGFFLFAVGSVIEMNEMPAKILESFKNAFSRLPQRVIWQWRGAKESLEMPSNVLLSDWLPQQDLLGHPKCKGFLTHGGLLSTQEAVYHGVPVIGLPFVSDQENNMNKAVGDGYAIMVSWSSVNEDVLYDALRNLTSIPRSYRRNVLRLQSLLRDQLETPLDRAVFWSEYAIRHQGAPALKLASRDLSRIQRNMIDVYILLVFIAITVMTLNVVIAKFLLKKCMLFVRKSRATQNKSSSTATSK